MGDSVRIGTISSLEANGYVRVNYQDRDETTAPLHLFAGNGEYSRPNVGAQVLVLHASNDSSTAVVMGNFWGTADPPPQGAEYQKQINQQIYTATQGGTYIIHASDIRFEGSAGTITLSEIIGMKERIQKLEEGGS